MEKIFNDLSESLFAELNKNEEAILSFSGENSQFIRFNNASIRQTGIVNDAEIELKLISGNKISGGGFTVSGNKEIARGGRYDDLLKSLGAKKNIPAVGAAINLNNI